MRNRNPTRQKKLGDARPATTPIAQLALYLKQSSVGAHPSSPFPKKKEASRELFGSNHSKPLVHPSHPPTHTTSHTNPQTTHGLICGSRSDPIRPSHPPTFSFPFASPGLATERGTCRAVRWVIMPFPSFFLSSLQDIPLGTCMITSSPSPRLRSNVNRTHRH